MKQTILDIINASEVYKERALDAMCKGKVYVVVYGERIVCFWRTRRGAEFGVKQDSEYYHDVDTHEKVIVTEPLQIVEILDSEIVQKVYVLEAIEEGSSDIQGVFKDRTTAERKGNDLVDSDENDYLAFIVWTHELQ